MDELLALLKQRMLVKARGRQRTDSTHVLAAIRNLNRLELVGETMRHALNSLAVVVPGWLRAQVPAEWFDRYSRPFSEWQLSHSELKREELAETIGQDGFDLWEMISQSPQAELLRLVPAVETLRQVWLQQYYVDEGRPRWRQPKDMLPSRQKIISPHDTEARFSVRRNTRWKSAISEAAWLSAPRPGVFISEINHTRTPVWQIASYCRCNSDPSRTAHGGCGSPIFGPDHYAIGRDPLSARHLGSSTWHPGQI